jgi:hypothetical protein
MAGLCGVCVQGLIKRECCGGRSHLLRLIERRAKGLSLFEFSDQYLGQLLSLNVGLDCLKRSLTEKKKNEIAYRCDDFDCCHQPQNRRNSFQHHSDESRRRVDSHHTFDRDNCGTFGTGRILISESGISDWLESSVSNRFRELKCYVGSDL